MKIIGFTKNNEGEKYTVLMSCYHLHVDKDLGIDIASVRQIPCNCESCYNRKFLKWVTNVPPNLQPRFHRNLDFHYSSVFGEQND